ncbi:MAG: hypothetical protein K9W43_07060 [Candidatus Thorarchaeota archaeon]|nr:hypothetical protein [Candidatus Thorarchaeota archaeon]
MKLRKWLMKQQWRIVQIRGIWGLFYGILLLAISFFKYVPIFANMGTLGPFAFSAVLLIFFMILGYIYDRVFIMWAPSQEVSMERNPYQYVPSPKDHIFWFPLYASLLETAEALAKKYDVDTKYIRDARAYYAKLQNLRPERNKDLDFAVQLRDEFIKEHPFKNDMKK